MDEEIKKLREAGFTDADIQAYINDQKSRAGQSQPVAPEQVDPTQPPPADETVPAYSSNQSSFVDDATAAVMLGGKAIAPYVLPTVATAATGYVAGPPIARRIGRAFREGALNADANRTPGYMEPERSPIKVGPAGPVDPNATRTRVPINQPGAIEVPQNTGGQPRPGTTRLPSGTKPVQPTMMPQQPKIGGPAAAEGANFIENISKKYLPAAGRAFSAAMDTPVGRAVGTTARVVGSAPVMGAQLALSPSSTGPAVPSVGRLRGSEINPMTRRPWTAQELVMYEKNPAMFDQQLPAPQMPR